MKRWFSRHPRARFVFVILVAVPLIPLGLVGVLARECREACATLWAASADAVRRDLGVVAWAWREAFPRRKGV